MLQFYIVQSELLKLKDVIEFDMCAIKAVKVEKIFKSKKKRVDEAVLFKWKHAKSDLL